MPTSVAVDQDLRTFTLPCGMPLLVERAENVRSVAICWLVPVGNASDPEGEAGDGQSVLLSELVLRGAGTLSSRQLSDALDRLGVQRSVTCGPAHIQLSATLLGDRLLEALPLLASIIRAPALPAEHLDPVRSLAIQAIEGLQEDPQQRVMLQLRERHLPPPFNRSGLGNREALERTTIETLRSAWTSRCLPRGSILGIAGDVHAEAIRTSCEELLQGWNGTSTDAVELRPAIGGTTHETSESSQTHIGIAYKAPPERDPDATLFRLATRILGGDTSSRLFMEVREKRGLCYSVSAGYSGGRDRGMLALYAGSTPERAQETVDCIGEVVASFERGVTEAEFARAVVGYKSRLVMSGESTGARAAAAAGDWYRLGRVRSLAELAAEVDAISLERLNAYIAKAFGNSWRTTRTAATIGPKPLDW